MCRNFFPGISGGSWPPWPPPPLGSATAEDPKQKSNKNQIFVHWRILTKSTPITYSLSMYLVSHYPLEHPFKCMMLYFCHKHLLKTNTTVCSPLRLCYILLWATPCMLLRNIQCTESQGNTYVAVLRIVSYMALHTMCFTIGYMYRVGWMGHGSCYCIHTGHVIQYDASSASSARVLMAGRLLYKGWDHVEQYLVWASVTPMRLALNVLL